MLLYTAEHCQVREINLAGIWEKANQDRLEEKKELIVLSELFRTLFLPFQ